VINLSSRIVVALLSHLHRTAVSVRNILTSPGPGPSLIPSTYLRTGRSARTVGGS
jgi:hypothetical protein